MSIFSADLKKSLYCQEKKSKSKITSTRLSHWQTYRHFLNSLFSHRHIHDTWIQRLSKKLSHSVFATNSLVIFNWEIHIVEGPDVKKIIIVLILGICVTLAVTELWWSLTKDVQGATGLESLLMNTTALWTGYFISLSVARWWAWSTMITVVAMVLIHSRYQYRPSHSDHILFTSSTWTIDVPASKLSWIYK